jgi:predicted lipid carrier protein YhbT
MIAKASQMNGKFPMTRSYDLPARLAGWAMRPLPAAALSPLLDLAIRLVKRRHPGLMDRLAALAPARILVEPTDIKHRFLISLAEEGVRLEIAHEDDDADASIKGGLAALIDLMEGRIDGDTLFFNRSLAISGDTAVIVALRNTLDGEEISLMNDVLSFLGPFARPAERAIAFLDSAASRFEASLKSLHRAAHGGRDADAQHDKLKEEVATLKARLAKLESKRGHAGGAA